MANLSDGIGLGLDSALMVLRVFEGTSAEANGVTIGCRVLCVNGRTISDHDSLLAEIQRCRDLGLIDIAVDYARPVADGTASFPKWSEAARDRLMVLPTCGFSTFPNTRLPR